MPRYLDAMLQKGVCRLRAGPDLSGGSADRTKYLKEALEQFDSLYKNHREQWAGLAAQMWQAKCFEEQGEIGAAIGALQAAPGAHRPAAPRSPAPRRLLLHRGAGQAEAVRAGGRRGDRAGSRNTTAARSGGPRRVWACCWSWPRPSMPRCPRSTANERPKATKQIIDAVSQVVRYASPYKNDALALLKKYKPSAAMKAEEIARLTYQDAMEQADEAIASHEWDRAIILLKAAIAKADPVREHRQGSTWPRYNLAFCYLHEQAILRGRRAGRAPGPALSRRAVCPPRRRAIAMQALAEAYNTYTEIDRLSDLDRLVDLATYTAETWPDREEGDDARLNLGQISLGRGQYDQAIAAFGAVRRRSSKWLEAQTRLGAAHWAKSRVLERRGDNAGAAAEGQKAIERATGRLKARRDAGAGPTDPGLVGNVGDLAIVLTESGKAAEALQLLDPVVKAQTVKSGPGLLPADGGPAHGLHQHDQVQQAIATMKALEQAGGGASLTPALPQAGQAPRAGARRPQPEGEHGGLRPDAPVLQDVPDDPRRRARPARPTSRWSGPARACCRSTPTRKPRRCCRRVLKEFTQDPQFLQQPGGRMSCSGPGSSWPPALRGQKASSTRPTPSSRSSRAESHVSRAAVREGHAPGGRGRGESAANGRPRCGTGRDWPEAWSGTGRRLRSITTPGTTWPGCSRSRTKRQGAPGAPGHHAADSERRQPRDEGEIRGPARAPIEEVRDRRMTTQFAQGIDFVSGRFRPRRRRWRLLSRSRSAACDDVSLIRPGTTVKQAIGGRVAARSSRSRPARSWFSTGRRPTTVPTDQIVSIRYDGQSAKFQLGREPGIRRPTRRGRRALQEGGHRDGRQPFPPQAALFREAQALGDLAMVEPERHEGGQGQAQPVRAGLSGQPPHRRRARAAWPGSRSTPAISRAPMPPSPTWPGSPRPASARPCSAPRCWRGKGSTTQAIAELDRLIASSPKGSERQRAAMLAKAESLAGMKKFKEAETLVRQVIQASPPEDAAAQAPAYNTLGDCLRAANRPKEALIAYLHTDLLYSKDKEEHPRALHAISRLVPPAQAGRPGRRICPTAQAGVSALPLVHSEDGGDRVGGMMDL